MNGHEATHNAGKGKKSTREVSSYEAQMIICILIIYPLAVSVHVMNENVFFSLFASALNHLSRAVRLRGIIKAKFFFVYELLCASLVIQIKHHWLAMPGYMLEHYIFCC